MRTRPQRARGPGHRGAAPRGGCRHGGDGRRGWVRAEAHSPGLLHPSGLLQLLQWLELPDVLSPAGREGSLPGLWLLRSLEASRGLWGPWDPALSLEKAESREREGHPASLRGREGPTPPCVQPPAPRASLGSSCTWGPRPQRPPPAHSRCQCPKPGSEGESAPSSSPPPVLRAGGRSGSLSRGAAGSSNPRPRVCCSRRGPHEWLLVSAPPLTPGGSGASDPWGPPPDRAFPGPWPSSPMCGGAHGSRPLRAASGHGYLLDTPLLSAGQHGPQAAGPGPEAPPGRPRGPPGPTESSKLSSSSHVERLWPGERRPTPRPSGGLRGPVQPTVSESECHPFVQSPWVYPFLPAHSGQDRLWPGPRPLTNVPTRHKHSQVWGASPYLGPGGSPPLCSITTGSCAPRPCPGGHQHQATCSRGHTDSGLGLPTLQSPSPAASVATRTRNLGGRGSAEHARVAPHPAGHGPKPRILPYQPYLFSARHPLARRGR